MRLLLTPRLSRNCFTLIARRSPSARLYSTLPRWSQWPEISNFAEGCLLSQSACLVRMPLAFSVSWERLKSK